MTIIDSQVHAYEANTSKRPWHSVPSWPPHVTGMPSPMPVQRCLPDPDLLGAAANAHSLLQ
jgi:hypothetical protein